jgi:hypothetical protein
MLVAIARRLSPAGFLLRDDCTETVNIVRVRTVRNESLYVTFTNSAFARCISEAREPRMHFDIHCA